MRRRSRRTQQVWFSVVLSIAFLICFSNTVLLFAQEATPSESPTEAPPTETPIPSSTETLLPTPTETLLPTPTETPLPSPTDTLLPSPSDTETASPTNTATQLPTNTPTREFGVTETPMVAPTMAVTPSASFMETPVEANGIDQSGLESESLSEDGNDLSSNGSIPLFTLTSTTSGPGTGSSCGQNRDLGKLNGTAQQFAQTILIPVGGGGTLSQFSIRMGANHNSPTGGITWNLTQIDSSTGQPGVPYVSGTFTPVPNSVNTISVSTSYVLQDNTTYVLWFQAINQSAFGSNTYYTLCSAGSNVYAGGNLWRRDNGTWSQVTNDDLRMTMTTVTPTATPTFTPTNTPTNTPTFTPTFTPTNTSTDTPTFTPTNTPTNTPTFTPTVTSTLTPTGTLTVTPTPGITEYHNYLIPEDPNASGWYQANNTSVYDPRDPDSGFIHNGDKLRLDLGCSIPVAGVFWREYEYSLGINVYIDGVLVASGFSDTGGYVIWGGWSSSTHVQFTPAITGRIVEIQYLDAQNGSNPDNNVIYNAGVVTYGSYPYRDCAPTPTTTPTDTPTPTPTPTETPTLTATPEICPAGTVLGPESVEGVEGTENALSPTCQEEGSGLRGDYYNGSNFEEYVGYRIDGPIDFNDTNWGFSPTGLNIPSDNFSVVWTGTIRINTSGEYTFCLESDDGVRLWIDEQLLIDNWTAHPRTRDCNTIALDPGFPSIHIEYYENSGEAIAQLLWVEPDCQINPCPPPQIVPYTVLYPANTQALILMPPAAYPQAIPVDTLRLRYIAQNYPQMLWGPGQTIPTVGSPFWNGEVGRWFQNKVVVPAMNPLVSPNATNIPTSMRVAAGGLPSTRPDGFATWVAIDIVNGIPQATPYPASNVIEIKARRGSITPGYESWQMIGMFDIALHVTALGQDPNRNYGAVTIISTSDTIISPSLKSRATANRIILCRARVFEIRGVTPLQSTFFVENAVLQNLDIGAALGNQLVVCPLWMNPPIQVQSGVPPIVPDDPDPDDNTISDIP